jgi:hypothetical protein
MGTSRAQRGHRMGTTKQDWKFVFKMNKANHRQVIGLIVFLLVAGEGFEPSTFGL